MNGRSRWSRIVIVVGLIAMCVGALDPLEGSLVILPGTAMVAVGALLSGSRRRGLLAWSFGLVAVGVGLLWGMDAMGGIGGTTGRSMWWALVLLPYPAGWVLAIVGAIRVLREAPRPAVPTDAR